MTVEVFRDARGDARIVSATTTVLRRRWGWEGFCTPSVQVDTSPDTLADDVKLVVRVARLFDDVWRSMDLGSRRALLATFWKTPPGVFIFSRLARDAVGTHQARENRSDILLSRKFVEEVSDQSVRSLIAHELAHGVVAARGGTGEPWAAANEPESEEHEWVDNLLLEWGHDSDELHHEIRRIFPLSAADLAEMRAEVDAARAAAEAR